MRRFFDVLGASFRIYSAYRRHSSSWMITLFEECGLLGGVYVKFLQQLAVTEMASEHFVAYGKHLEVYDKVPFEPLDLRRTLENEIGSKKDY